MQLKPLISSSNNFYYIDRLNDIIKIALSLKAQIYYVDAINNKIIGFFEEMYSIIETQVPFKITSSFLFSGTMISSNDKENIEINKTYFYIPEYPYIIFPENRRADVMNQNIGFNSFNGEIVDIMTGKVLDDCIITMNPNEWFLCNNYSELLKSYYLRQYTLCENSYEFIDMENNPIIQEVTSNKITQGAKILSLQNVSGKSFTFYIFKNLLGPLTKADKLSIIITPDKAEFNKFKATFRVYKKKSKLGIPELNSMIIDTNVFMLNLS